MRIKECKTCGNSQDILKIKKSQNLRFCQGLGYFECHCIDLTGKPCQSTLTIYQDVLKAVALNNLPPTIEECKKRVMDIMMSEIEAA